MSQYIQPPQRPNQERVTTIPFLVVLIFLVLVGCSGTEDPATLSERVCDWDSVQDRVESLKQISYVDGERVLFLTEDVERDFVVGVNLGSTIPGHGPGEVAIRAEDYRRWFPQMAELGLLAVRVYTILSPQFYEELAAYNTSNPDRPLYLLQGVWIPEERFLATKDLFDVLVREGFRAEISDAVAAVHGDLVRSQRPGHAGGSYSADVSPWLLAYSIGVELDPQAAFASEQANASRTPFNGQFFTVTPDANSIESWLAEMLDHLAAEEACRGRTMPLTFTNWVTTDPLVHPDDPDWREDLVGIDANHIQATEAWPSGFFASYHIYPYYPDFLRYEPGIADYMHGGRVDPYAGYLAAIRRHHVGMPVMVTEFGVPSSQGSAHYDPLGRDHGDLSEQEQMAINADLLRIIHDLGFSGGFVFEWVDEWFKFTWNTLDYELPAERRALWKNAWSSEQHFGLIAVEPGETPVALVDGDDQEWGSNSSQVIFESRGAVREVKAVKDEGYLYLRLIMDEPEVWERTTITLGFDLLEGGNLGLPGAPGIGTEADYAVTLGPGSTGQAWVRASNDHYAIQHGLLDRFIEVDPTAVDAESGVWHPRRLIVNRPWFIPATGQVNPAEVFDVGSFRFGTTDPADPEFDSRAWWAASGQVIEIRLPYMAIGFADPSSLQALRITPRGRVDTETVKRVGISVVLEGVLFQTKGYAWEGWNSVRWHERPKAGLEHFAEAVIQVLLPGIPGG